MTLRGQGLLLYRRILRVARTWESLSQKEADTQNERDYIRTEARTLFRKNMKVRDEGEIQEYLREGETRLELALHYGIPYPRQVNIPQHTLPPIGRRFKAQKRSLDQAQPIYLKSYKDESDKK